MVSRNWKPNFIAAFFVLLVCCGQARAQAPTITGISPTSGPVGTLVTITGTGFGTPQGTSTVSLGAASATVVTWSDLSISVTVPSGSSTGSFSVTVGGNPASSSTFTITALPSGWTDGDIGSVGVAGTASYANGVFTVTGAGAQVYGTADAFQFLYQQMSGDGSIVARLVGVQGGSSNASMGVMIRETLDPAAKNAKMADWPLQGSIYFDDRSAAGGSSTHWSGVPSKVPYWIKVARTGNTLSAYSSLDGINWTQSGGGQTVSMAQSVYVGLAVTSGSTTALATGTFDNVSINSTAAPAPSITSLSATKGWIGDQIVITGSGFGASQGSSVVLLNNVVLPVNSWSASSITITVPTGAASGLLVISVAPSMNDSNPVIFTVLPPVWQHQDVGTTGLAGSASYSNQAFVVQGAGAGVTGTGDGFQFGYQPLSGDGTIVARVASTSNSNAQAGVMIRETLAANSANAFMASYAGNVYLWDRPSTGASTSYQQLYQNVNQTRYSVALPYWMKLVRSGSTFSGYVSGDGVNWAQVGTSLTISMAQNVYVGLGVTSQSTSILYSSTFDNVSVSSVASPAPQITGVSATTASVGSQVVITGQSFGTTQGNSQVLLHGVAVTVNSWSATSITITLPTGATSGYLVVSVAPNMNDSNVVDFAVSSNPLPQGWLDQDVGPVGVAGSASYANGVFTVAGSGNGIGNGATDNFHFMYQPFSGDGTIVARVVSVSNGLAQTGVMIRETLNTGSSNAYSAIYNVRSNLWYRPNTGASASNVQINGSAAVPYWVKLVRSGNTFSAYASADGYSWAPVDGPATVNMAQTVYVGLGVSSTSTNSLYSATFDNVSVSPVASPAPVITGLSTTTGPVGSQVIISGLHFGTTQGPGFVTLNAAPVTVNSWSGTSITVTIPTGATTGWMVVTVGASANDSNPVTFTVTSQPLPSGWLDLDIGSVGVRGTASYAGSVFTVQGGGTTVGSTSDAFHFVYQPLTANGTLTARVVSVTGSSQSVQATVMMRETLDAFSAEVSTYLQHIGSTYSDGMNFRTVIGGGTSQANGPAATAPYWLKVSRSANSFTSYVSSDGATWVQVGTSQTFTTAQSLFVGLGVGGNSLTSLGTATFDNVSITLGTSLPNPVVSGLAPTTGGPGTSVTISGSGFGGTQGTSTVNFNSVAAAVTSWSDTQISANVPDGATTGPVSVVVGNITGQGPSFTVAVSATLTDSLGNQTTYSSSLFGGQWFATDVQGSGCSSCTSRGNIHNQFDGRGNVAWTTDALGHTTAFKFDSSNNLAAQYAEFDPNTIATTTYTYNSLGQVLTVTDPLGNKTTNVYDTHGNLTSVTTPAPNGNTAASVTSFTYNTIGQLLTITDPLSHVTTLTYTTAGLIATIKDAQNNVTTYAYDTHGNRTSVTDALSHQTTFAYDTGDRLTTITYPDSTTTTFAYDNRGRRTSVTDQNSKTTTYAYDDADRLTSVKDAANNTTTYAYDTENNLTGITDANSHSTTFTYDAFGRVTKTNFPSTLSETYAYDANNNLTTKTDRKSQTIQYVYDALNRLTRKLYPDSTEVDYVYDLVGKIQSVNDPTGTYAFAYDNMGRLIGTTTSYSFLTGRNFTTAYAYDKASNRTGFTDPESGATAYVYDTLNRLQTLTPPAAFTATGNFGFTYDALSRRTQMTRPNAVASNYAYDNLSRLASVLHQLSGSTIDGATYTVDNGGNRTAKTDNRTSVASSYGYDAIYELTGVTQGTTTTESYTYDPIGNRLSSLGVSPYSVNVSNEMTSTPTTTYTYDNNGNTLTSVTGSNTTQYFWDFENRMSSVTLPGSGGTVGFKYDPFGRRIYKSSSAGTSVYAYDSDNLIEETNASGAVVVRYEHNLNIDEPFAMLRSGTTSYYNADGLGSVTSLANSAGALAQTYTFDSFGKLTASSGSLTNPFQYTARESDSETGLYYYRARYYDPNVGRFTSEDPLTFAGGVDFYGYVLNRPIQVADPRGLSPQDVQRIRQVCHSCVQNMVKAGVRRPGGGEGPFNGSGDGFLNDQSSNQSIYGKATGSKILGCKDQADRGTDCLYNANAIKPFDAHWDFSPVAWWGGFHTIVRAKSSDQNDPIVYCDPWRDLTWTALQNPPEVWPHYSKF